MKPINFDVFFKKLNLEYPDIFMNHMKEERFGQWKGLLQDMFQEKLRNLLTCEIDTSQIYLSALNDFAKAKSFKKSMIDIVEGLLP